MRPLFHPLRHSCLRAGGESTEPPGKNAKRKRDKDREERDRDRQERDKKRDKDRDRGIKAGGKCRKLRTSDLRVVRSCVQERLEPKR